MLQTMINYLWTSNEKKIYVFFLVLVSLISLCYVEFNTLQLGNVNFWLWQLYINSELYIAIVGLPLIYSLGNYFVSSLIFSDSLVILRFKDRSRLFKYELLVQLIFLIVFILVVSLISIVISILSTNFDLDWSINAIKQYSILFTYPPYLDMVLIHQVFFTHITFWFYLLFLMNLQQLLQLLVKERVAMFLIVSFIFLQSIFYKMNYQAQLFWWLPVYHYQVASVKNVVGELIYWVVGNLTLLLINYRLILNLNYFE
ncbi:hypothetical protein JDW15_08430 [Aerococcaceae bacterium zg-ZJ1578]|uniref:hypothetical protein n=1 Tax=Aerococcaceae bacterium zg-252 TaxID=2796928 RepID=UPI001A2A5EC0|nr:hypothetical protein [Aerococcaceae bacterium zg-1578]